MMHGCSTTDIAQDGTGSQGACCCSTSRRPRGSLSMSNIEVRIGDGGGGCAAASKLQQTGVWRWPLGEQDSRSGHASRVHSGLMYCASTACSPLTPPSAMSSCTSRDAVTATAGSIPTHGCFATGTASANRCRCSSRCLWSVARSCWQRAGLRYYGHPSSRHTSRRRNPSPYTPATSSRGCSDASCCLTPSRELLPPRRLPSTIDNASTSCHLSHLALLTHAGLSLPLSHPCDIVCTRVHLSIGVVGCAHLASSPRGPAASPDRSVAASLPQRLTCSRA